MMKAKTKKNNESENEQNNENTNKQENEEAKKNKNIKEEEKKKIQEDSNKNKEDDDNKTLSNGEKVEYLCQIPDHLHPFIRQVFNPIGDGNCGFCCVAKALGYEDDGGRARIKTNRRRTSSEKQENQDRSFQVAQQNGTRPSPCERLYKTGSISFSRRL
ncbi:hypothetical protein MJO29_000476 [Puccinia striiformis f. sp. tritici]|nr:hypothetical protein MJO29_000476 [Puccinia striiformis f. sp. tritici]